jgi:hypothetical protein
MKYSRGPPAQTRKATGDLLVWAARHVFATKGYEAANIRDIVRQSGWCLQFQGHRIDTSVIRAAGQSECLDGKLRHFQNCLTRVGNGNKTGIVAEFRAFDSTGSFQRLIRQSGPGRRQIGALFEGVI